MMKNYKVIRKTEIYEESYIDAECIEDALSEAEFIEDSEWIQCDDTDTYSIVVKAIKVEDYEEI